MFGLNDRISKIVEERDASPAERAIKEINAGIYAFDLAPLFDALRSIASQNAQGEFYLTDLIGIYRRRGLVVETASAQTADEIRGVNSRAELGEVGRLVRQKKNEELMASGVTIVDCATTYIDVDVTDWPRHRDPSKRGHRGRDHASARPARSGPTSASRIPASAIA